MNERKRQGNRRKERGGEERLFTSCSKRGNSSKDIEGAISGEQNHTICISSFDFLPLSSNILLIIEDIIQEN